MEPRIFHLLHLSHRAVFRAADRALTARFGITAAQQAALMYIGENEGASMGALAAAIGLKAAATSGLVDRMEKNGFLERRPSPDDGRSYVLFLRPDGREIVDDSRALIAESNAYMLDGYSDNDKRDLAGFLRTILERADAFQTQIIDTEKGNSHE